MREAHALIDDAILSHGPFDGAFGFSQGASIILSYLLEHAATHMHDRVPPPFRFAMLASCTLPFASDAVYFQLVFGSLTAEDIRRVRSCDDTEIALLPDAARVAITAVTTVVDAASSITKATRAFYLDRPVSQLPAALHPDLTKVRLSIPTLHIRGKNEASGLRAISLLAERFCDSEVSLSVEHAAGHDIPRSRQEVQQILSGIRWIVEESQLQLF